ncbi:MAG: hypothetical protein GXP55_01465 [Deltaproteobacteria bacterium]|nr:hypothetical protein [Deltaproteobacteria bacterium]
MAARRIESRYVDPLDAIWLSAAHGFGLELRRSEQVFASVDGRGVLTLGAAGTLDADDCLAQMIFHELCHSLVAGESGLHLPDWGLPDWSEDLSGVDLTPEHAALRVQAELAGAHGLRDVLAPTTDFRAYYDALPADPLRPGTDPALPLACEAIARATRSPWAPHLEQALVATARVVSVVAGLPSWRPEAPPLLFARYHESSDA